MTLYTLCKKREAREQGNSEVVELVADDDEQGSIDDEEGAPRSAACGSARKGRLMDN